MSEEEKQPNPPEMDEKDLSDTFEQKWSWGGLMMEQVLILASRRYWWLFLYLLMVVPLLNLVAIVGIKLYFALKGREFVRAGEGFETDEEYRGFMKGVDHAGKILFFIMLAILIIALLVSIFVGVSFFKDFEHFVEEGGIEMYIDEENIHVENIDIETMDTTTETEF